MIVLFLVFLRNFHTVFYSGCTNLTFPPTFPFLHILASICCLYSFWQLSFWQVWGDNSLWFWFSFSLWLAILSIFSCACWPSALPFWKNIYSVLPLFKFYFLVLRCMSCLHMLDINSLLFMSFANFISHSVDCLFILLMACVAVPKLLSLIRSNLFIFFFCFLCFGKWIEK